MTTSPADGKIFNANPLWGGRYSCGPAEILEAISASIDFDKRLAAHDIIGSKAHARMLARVGIINGADADKITEGLDIIMSEIDSGTFVFSRELEDIHMNIEARLRDVIGEPAGRLHTGRSRNDQVAVDFKMWVRDAIGNLDRLCAGLIDVLVNKAEHHYADIMPGFTHMQCAQPITLGHHWLAYAEMVLRDRGRLVDAGRRLNECPLGAAALAGTSFPVDRDFIAAELGFDRPTRNSLDAVSDRDFAIEFMSAAAILSMHLSRLGEELVLWTTSQFNFARMPEPLTAGSSIMPQKRNPDAAELVRAKTGRVFGNLVSLLVVLKGLPLAYCRDMQEDKEAVFNTADTLELCIRAVTEMVQGLEINTDAMHAAAKEGYSTATDLADWLVRELGMPFREAHHVTGRIVRLAEKRGVSLDQLTLEEMRLVEPRFSEAAKAALNIEHSVNSRNCSGGTAPVRVKKAAQEMRKLNAGMPSL